jgi:hypothetical protein
MRELYPLALTILGSAPNDKYIEVIRRSRTEPIPIIDQIIAAHRRSVNCSASESEGLLKLQLEGEAAHKDAPSMCCILSPAYNCEVLNFWQIWILARQSSKAQATHRITDPTSNFLILLM